MIQCSPRDQRGQWPPTPVPLGTISLVPLELGHVNQTLPGVEETLCVKVSSLLAPLVHMTSLTASCPTLTLSNGDITLDVNTSPTPVNTVATLTCNPTFVLSGGATRTCTDTASGGMWSGSTLTCIGKQSYCKVTIIIIVSLQGHVMIYPTTSLMEPLPIHQPLHVLMGALPLTLVGWGSLW